MKNYDTILSTLNEIDNDQKFSIRSEGDIVTLLRKNLANEHEKLDEMSLAEFYAFSAIENYRGPGTWSSYFGSPGTLVSDGSHREGISIDKINCSIIGYWKERLKIAKNPVLKARYAGLVWELENRICNARPDYKEIAIPYIENLLASVNDNIINSFPGCREKLARALHLSVVSKNDHFKKKSVESVFRFQESRAKPDGAGTWRASYDLLIKPGIVKRGETEYTKVIECLGHWFGEAIKNDGSPIDLSAAEAVFEPLMNQYIKDGPTSELSILLIRMEECVNRKIAICSAAEGMHWLEKMMGYYTQAGNKDKAKEIAVRLQDLGPKLIGEMKLIRTEQTFSKDEIDNFVEGVLSQPHEHIFMILPACFIPDTETVMTNRKQRGIHISDIVSKSSYSGQGRKVATLGSIDSDVRGRTIDELQIHVKISALFLHFVLMAGRERNILSTAAFMDFVRRSTVVSPDRYQFFEKVYDAWQRSDYLVFLHLIIPQIEAACLLIAKEAGATIQKENKYGGYNVILFGDLLRSDGVVQKLGANGVDYFQTLFSDPRGLNLRNELAHGLRDFEGFDENTANLVLIALLHLIASTIGE